MEKLETEFAQIVKEQKDTIYTVCYMFSKDAEEINDLFQEILVNLISANNVDSCVINGYFVKISNLNVPYIT